MAISNLASAFRLYPYRGSFCFNGKIRGGYKDQYVLKIAVVIARNINRAANVSTDFVLGGGFYRFSIGGVFSHDCRSNVTSGLIVSGSAIPAWTDVIPAEYREM